MDRTWLETHLSLLRYGDELSTEQVAEVLEHLAQLPDDADLRTQIEGVGHALDALSLAHPHPERLRSLKDDVLQAVQAPFAAGEPVLEVEPLSTTEHAGVEAALSLAPAVPVHPGLAGLREQILAQVDAPLPASELAGLEAALNLAPAVPLHPELSGLRGAVLAQVGEASAELSPAEYTELEAALDLWAEVPSPEGLSALKATVLAEVGSVPQGGELLRFPTAFVGSLLAAAAAALVACGIALGGWVNASSGINSDGALALKRSADFATMNGRFEIAEENYRLILETKSDPEILEQVRQELASIRDYRTAQLASDPLERQRQVATLLRDKPSALVVPLAFYNDLNKASVAAAVTHQQLAFDPTRALRFDELGVPDNVRDILTDSTLQVILIQQGLRWEQLGDLIQAKNCYERAIQIDPVSPEGAQAKQRLALLG